MRCVGIDVASAGYTALGLAVDGKPVRAQVWKPKDKRDSDAVRLEDQWQWMRNWLRIFKPDVIAVEELAVFMNKNVIRSIGSP